jgi:hypothetical protein
MEAVQLLPCQTYGAFSTLMNEPPISSLQVQLSQDNYALQAQALLCIDPRKGFFHAMLSYRVSPDQDFVTKLHDKIHLLNHSKMDSFPWPAAFHQDSSAQGSNIRVFQDAFCLKDGMGWEGDGSLQSGGFVGALKLSVVFVPLFSAKVDQSGHLQPVGSIGQMADLEGNDKQDNVLLELVLARELYLQSRQSNKSILLPCSRILPLFYNKAVFDAAKKLPNRPSALTNSKALSIMKSIGFSDSHLSKELKDGTLSPADVWSFYGQFQGIMLYERGAEKYQVEAGAMAVIGVVADSASAFKLNDLDANYAQLYELFDFLSSLNMAHYTKVFATHNITSVFDLSSLNVQDDTVIKLIAEHGVKSTDSSVAAEIVKLRSTIAAAKGSRHSKLLNDRFRDFIDQDASLVTLLQSSSLVDHVLSKTLFLALVFIICLGLAIWRIVKLSSAAIDETLYFPNDLPSRFAMNALQVVFLLLSCIAVLVCRLRSPRDGRYAFVVAVGCYFCALVWMLAVSISSAIKTNCHFCANVDELVSSQKSPLLNILNQPWQCFPVAVLMWTMMFRQDLLVPLSLGATVFFHALPGFVFLIYFGSFKSISATQYIVNSLMWLLAFGVIKLLLLIGKHRASEIYAINELKANSQYEIVRSKFKDNIAFFKAGDIPATGFMTLKSLCPARPDVSEFSSLQMLSSCSIFQDTASFQDLFWHFKVVGRERVCQQHSTFESLVRDAEFINIPFQEWVSSWLTGGPSEDTIHKYLHHNDGGGIDAAFVTLSKGTVEHIQLGAAALDRVLGEDIADPCVADAPLIARAGDKVNNEMLTKLLQYGFSHVHAYSSNAIIRGMHVRGPVKHVDRAIAKVVFFNVQLIKSCVIYVSGIPLLWGQV